MAQNILAGHKPGKDTTMKKPIISRTIINHIAFVTMFDMESKSVIDISAMLPATVDTVEKAEKFIRKNPSTIPGKLVMVNKVERSEMLIGMYVDDFIKNAKEVTERNKETRGTVTKTVQTCIGTALYMDDKRNVCEKVVTFPVNLSNVDGFIRKNYTFPGQFITVENVETIETLYSMDENTFIALAKPMRNKFQLAD